MPLSVCTGGIRDVCDVNDLITKNYLLQVILLKLLPKNPCKKSRIVLGTLFIIFLLLKTALTFSVFGQ